MDTIDPALIYRINCALAGKTLEEQFNYLAGIQRECELIKAAIAMRVNDPWVEVVTKHDIKPDLNVSVDSNTDPV